MEQEIILSMLDLRKQVHDLTLRKHASGLSPPEEELMIIFEAAEYSEAEQDNE